MHQQNILVLSPSSLSNLFRQKALQVIGCSEEAPVVTLGELRRLGITNLVSVLWKNSPTHLCIVLETWEAQTLQPLLQILAIGYRAKRVTIVLPDFTLSEISPYNNFFQIPLLFWATLRNLFCCTSTSLRAFCLFRAKRISVRDRARISLCGIRNILYYKTNLWFGVKAGGSLAHVAGVCNELNSRGLMVTLAASESQATVASAIPQITLAAPLSYGLTPEANLFSFDMSSSKQISGLLKQIVPDMIYHRLALNSLSAVEISRTLGIPLILEYNSSEVWAQLNWGPRPLTLFVGRQCEQVVLMHAHLVVTVSKVLEEELLNRGVEAERIVCVPNGVDAKVFDPSAVDFNKLQELRRGLEIGPSSTVVGFLGTFGRWHGVEVFAEAVALLAKEATERLSSLNVRFLFVGDGIMMPLVKDILSDHLPFCRLPGLCAQVEAPLYLGLCDIVVSPHITNKDGSRFFGSPTKLFEYMAMGKAIIASDLEQVGSVLSRSNRYEAGRGFTSTVENPLGVLLEPGDARSLAGAIISLTEDPNLAREMGRNARQEALDKYTWGSHVDQILQRLFALSSQGKL